MEITATSTVDHSVEMNLSESASGWGDGEDGVGEGYDWDKSIHIMCTVIYSLLCVLGVLGNGVVIWATGFRMKKNVNTVWYLNLAVADFLATAFLPLQITQRALGGRWPFGPFMCKVDRVVFYVNMYASVFTLALISVDRCACVVRPVWTRHQRSVRKASWVSVGVWALALAPNVPGFFVFKDAARPSYDGEARCYSNYAFLADWSGRTPEETQAHAFRLAVKTIARFLAGFVVPFGVIVSCYSVVVWRLRNNRSLAGRSGRSSKIVATVIAAFFLCWFPFHVVQLIRLVHFPVLAHTPMSLAVKFGVPVASALALLNSCLNPLLYVSTGRAFKNVFRGSALKVLEKAFAEEPSRSTENTSTDPAVSRPQTALTETLL